MRRRSLLALAHATRTGLLVATFSVGLLGGIALHSNLPAVRRLASQAGNDALASLFAGKIEARDITYLSLGRRAHVHLREAEVTSPEGARVILAREVDAEIDLAKLVRSLLATGTPDIELDSVRIAEADIALDVDASGSLALKRAFERRAPPPPATPETSEPQKAAPEPQRAARTPVFRLEHARIGKAHVHGNLVPPALDGDASELAARIDLERDVVTVTLSESRVTLRSPRAPNQTAPLTGSVTGFFAADLGATPTSFRSKLDLHGTVGEIPVVAHAELDGEQVMATVDIAKVEPAVLARTFSGLPLTKPIEIHAKAHGKLPTIAVEARAELGGGATTARGEIDLREGNAFSVDVDTTRLDTSSFGTDFASDVSGNVHAEGTFGGGAGPQGTFRITTQEGSVAKQPLPIAKVEGRFEGRHVTAVVRANEPGIEATGKLDVDIPVKGAGTGAPVVTFDLQARSSSLKALARAPNVASGTATARARGKIDLENGTINATANVAGENVAASALSARRIAANGVVSGPLASPLLTVGFAGTDLRVATGGKEPVTYPSASGSAKIALADGPHILEADVAVTHPSSSEAIAASVRDLRVRNGVVETKNLRITGLGEPIELDGQLGRGSWNLHAKSSGVDLHRAARLTGLPALESLPEGTVASVDIDVHQGADGPRGHIDVSVKSEKGLLASGAVTAEAHATIDRGKLAGNARVVADGIGRVEVFDADVTLPTRLDAHSLQRAVGSAELRGSIDLSQGAALFAGEHVERMSGLVSFEGRIERGDPTSLPAIRVTARSEALEIAVSVDPAAPTLLVSGVDVQAHAAWDGSSNDAEVAVLSWDKHGLLAHAGAKTKMPIVDWLTGKTKLDRRALADLAASAFAEIPSREVAELPGFIGLPDLRGRIEGRVSVLGTLGRPNVVASARAESLREDRRKNAGATSFAPIDGTLEGRWDGERAAITFALDERERRRRPPPGMPRALAVIAPPPRLPPSRESAGRGRSAKSLGRVRGLVLVNDLRIRDLLRGKTVGELPWVLSGELEVENLDLRPIARGLNGVTGTMTGRARLRDLNRKATFEATAHVDDFAVGGAVVDALDVTTTGRDESLFARVTIVDHRETEPTQITAQLTSKSLRIRGIDVSWDSLASTRLDYAVQNGRLALLTPLIKGAVSELDGRVDGTGSVTIDESTQVFDGGLAVQDARLYVNALGEEVTALDATARFERSGTFRIDDASGKMGGGEFRASATGLMKGFKFMSGEATVIASSGGIPISAEGATFAEAVGEAKVTAKMSEDRKTLDLGLTVPRANVEIPDRSTQALQALEPDRTIDTGIRGRDGKLDTTVVRKSRGGTGKQAAVAASNLATRLDVALGNEVRIEGRGLDVKITGRALVEVRDEVSVTGQIDVRGGTIEVQGRSFTIDHGTVTFPDPTEPTNPTIVAAAYWDAPDRTRVWAEFRGPMKGAVVTLRSEPSYSPDEILSILLFGRPDPNAAAGKAQAGGSTQATGTVAAGGSAVVAPLNQQLSRLDKDLDIETDTASGNQARVKVGRSFFDRRLKVQVAQGFGNATYREPDRYFVFVNWQFIPKWSVVAQRGDRGTTIFDLLFQHRY